MSGEVCGWAEMFTETQGKCWHVDMRMLVFMHESCVLIVQPDLQVVEHIFCFFFVFEWFARFMVFFSFHGHLTSSLQHLAVTDHRPI